MAGWEPGRVAFSVFLLFMLYRFLSWDRAFPFSWGQVLHCNIFPKPHVPRQIVFFGVRCFIATSTSFRVPSASSDFFGVQPQVPRQISRVLTESLWIKGWIVMMGIIPGRLGESSVRRPVGESGSPTQIFHPSSRLCAFAPLRETNRTRRRGLAQSGDDG